jgi:siroheme synthase
VAHGLPASTPVALIENGTTDRERRVVGTLATIERQVMRARLDGPTLCVVGEVVGLALADFRRAQSGAEKASEFKFESRVGL